MNRYYKRIRLSHRMDRADVVRCCALGGLEITPSRAEAWSRSPSDTRRHSMMTEPEFDAFTSGLPQWAAENYD